MTAVRFTKYITYDLKTTKTNDIAKLLNHNIQALLYFDAQYLHCFVCSHCLHKKVEIIFLASLYDMPKQLQCDH